MLLLVLAILLAWPGSAAVITGTVRDPQGQPVAHARVRLDDRIVATTDEEGTFSLEVDGAAAHTLAAEFDNFVPVDQPIDVRGDLRVDLSFTQVAGLVQFTTVTGEIGAGDIHNPDAGRQVFIRDEMLDANPGRPGAPLSIPGLPVETASGGIKAPQYFSPGVAGDHGEPIAQFLQVGSYLVPNNLSANAHGNGYADPNLLIPAAIESVGTDGGAFNVNEDNHAVNQAITYGFRERLEPFVAIQGDAHDADIAAGWSPASPATHAWIALETAFGDGLLRTPEQRRQYKLNGYRVLEFGHHELTLLGIGYYGESKVPGLVPIGVASLNDTIDSRQRDQTHTGEIAVNDIWRRGAAEEFHFSSFFRTYNLALDSDFGDGLIRQSEFRTAAGAQTTYVRRVNEFVTILAGADYNREAPRRLDLDRYETIDPTLYGPFHKITSNNVTLNTLSPYVSLNGRVKPWLRFNLGWRRDEIGFNNHDLLAPEHSYDRLTGVNAPKATLNLIAPDSLPLPSVSFSFGQSYFTNDPRVGVGNAPLSLVSRAHAFQVLATKTILGAELRVEAGHVTQEQSLAKIDPDTGLQYNQGPSRNQYITFSMRRRFHVGMLQASYSRADARDLLSGEPVPEAPRMILDVLGTVDRLPFHLRAKGEYEDVGRKPLGDGFIGIPVREFRWALVRPFWDGRLEAGVDALIAHGYTGQTTEVLALPGQAASFERVVGVRIPSYAGISLKLHL